MYDCLVVWTSTNDLIWRAKGLDDCFDDERIQVAWYVEKTEWMTVSWMDAYEWLHLMIKWMDDYLVDGHINEKANG